MDSRKEKDVKEKIDRLVTRILERKVVPFLGAGISYGATNENSGKDDLARTPEMRKRLAKEIHRMHGSNLDEWGKWCCKASGCKKLTDKTIDCAAEIEKEPADSACSVLKASFDKLCEMNICPDEKRARKKLVEETLKIQEFAKLEPMPAHRYIAFLAKEELIDEIITTNYDTCLERAYEDIFRSNDEEFEGRQANKGAGKAQAKTHDKNHACVISRLEEYREDAGKNYFADNKGRWRYLKIYKINGCAKKLLDRKIGLEEILLTESDLQNWRTRAWAKDLFRDRLRSRTYLFSGFGNDEPQVRHTALQVVEEFKNTEHGTRYSAWWNLPNAPFIVEYGENLSFNQLQILRAYAEVYERRLTINKIQKNAFTGQHAFYFENAEPTVKSTVLDPRVFWERIFQATFWRLLREEYGHPDSAAYSFLSAITPSAEFLLGDMLNWLAPKNEQFGRFPQLLELPENVEDKIIPLARWVWNVRHKRMGPPEGWYASLARRPVVIPMLLLVIYLLFDEKTTKLSWSELNEQVFANNGILSIPVLYGLGKKRNEIRVLIAHSDRLFDDQEIVELPSEHRQRMIP